MCETSSWEQSIGWKGITSYKIAWKARKLKRIEGQRDEEKVWGQIERIHEHYWRNYADNLFEKRGELIQWRGVVLKWRYHGLPASQTRNYWRALQLKQVRGIQYWAGPNIHKSLIWGSRREALIF